MIPFCVLFTSMFGIFFIYLLFIIYSTLVFILSILLSLRVFGSFGLFISPLGVIVHQSSWFVIRILEFYISLFPSSLGIILIIIFFQYQAGDSVAFLLA